MEIPDNLNLPIEGEVNLCMWISSFKDINPNNVIVMYVESGEYFSKSWEEQS